MPVETRQDPVEQEQAEHTEVKERETCETLWWWLLWRFSPFLFSGQSREESRRVWLRAARPHLALQRPGTSS